MGYSRLNPGACIFLIALFLATAVLSGSSNGEAQNSQPAPKPSRQTILDCVKRYTGFDESYNVEKIELVALSELRIPFLSSTLKDQTGIRVRFALGKIQWSPPLNSTEDPYDRQISVFLDADAKQLLAVAIRLTARPADIQPLPLEKQEAALRNGGVGVVYDSFPASEPKVNFLQALATAHSKGLAGISAAREIDGFYLNVVSADHVSKIRARWIIIMRGIPPMRMPSASSRSTFIRNFVDPSTGEWLGGGASSGPGF